MKNDHKISVEIKRIGGHLKEVVTFLDASGKSAGRVINPLMVEFRPRDIAQIFVGSFLVATPLCFTEEVWNLSKELPQKNIIFLIIFSTLSVLFYVYFNFYKNGIKGHVIEFIKRIIAIYTISTFSVVLMLLLIDKFPIFKSPEVAFNRIVIIGFPSIFGGVITDSLK